MKRFYLISLFILGFAVISSLHAQNNIGNSCRDCPLPKHPNSNFVPKDSTLDVYFKDSRNPLYDVRSVKRSMMKRYGKLEQALQIKLLRSGYCFDTLIFINEVDKLSVTGLGLGGQTLNVPVYPAREYFREAGYSASKPNFFEITGGIGILGSDDSKRKVGADGMVYGVQALIAPFGNMLGRSVKLALGGGLMTESSRTRYPIMGHLRWTFMGSEREEEFFNYEPSPCKFGLDGEAPISIKDPTFIEVPKEGRIDSTVYFYEDKILIRDDFRPYVFLEGGSFIDGSFEGSGSEPALNPEDYGQFFVGLGFGVPLFDIISTNLSFRYMQTNLRTPCTACGDKFIVNTNKAFGVFLSVGFIFEF